MIIETYLLKNDCVIVELTPETKEEEESLRNAKVLHKNNIMVYWGDTLELHNKGNFIGYSGLKVSIKLPKEEHSSNELMKIEGAIEAPRPNKLKPKVL